MPSLLCQEGERHSIGPPEPVLRRVLAATGAPPHVEHVVLLGHLPRGGVDAPIQRDPSTARDRWLTLIRRIYASTGKMTEKYDVVDVRRRAGGGEYPTQDGFGWTNGVALALGAQERMH